MAPSTEMAGAGSHTRARMWAIAVSVTLGATVIFGGIARFTQTQLIMPGSPTVLWWPTAAIAIAILVRVPRSWWPGLLIGLAAALLWSRRASGLWTVALNFAVVNVAEVLVASLLLVGRGRATERRLRTRREALHFTIALGAALVAGATFIGVRALVEDLNESWATAVTSYVTTHIIGLMVFAPLLLPQAPRAPRTAWHRLEFVAALGATAAVGWWSFLEEVAPGRGFALLLPVAWAAARVGPMMTPVVTAAAVTIAAYGTARGWGPFTEISDLRGRALQAQLFFVGLAGTALLLVLITRHREYLAKKAEAGERTLRRAIRDSPVAMYSIRLDADHFGEIEDANTALATMLGYRPHELEGRYCGMLGARDYRDRQDVLDQHLARLRDGEITSLTEESQFIKSDGSLLWVETSINRVDPVMGEPFALVVAHDLTKRQENKQMLEAMALSDPLTGLANRTRLFDRLAEEYAQTSEGRVGLLFVDLDGFKEINDTYGHAAGDAALVEVARRLTHAVRPGDTVARLGGDEFAVLCVAVRTLEDLTHISDRVRRELAPEIALPDGERVRIGASIGLAIDDGFADADTLIKKADAEMYSEKRLTSRD